jgi:RNA polymerase sigma factor (sigma-70 family)
VRHFLGLAHTAMRNDARNQLRQSARSWRRMLCFHATLTEPADPLQEADDHEQERGVARLGTFLLLVVAGCFHELSARDRQVLLRREVEGLPYEELAVALGVPPNQIGTVLRRARERLMRKVAAALLLEERPAAASSASGGSTHGRHGRHGGSEEP